MSWQEEAIQQLLRLPGVAKYNLDMCRYGLRSTSANEQGLVRKPTTIMTNSQVMGKELSRQRGGGHIVDEAVDISELLGHIVKTVHVEHAAGMGMQPYTDGV